MQKEIDHYALRVGSGAWRVAHPRGRESTVPAVRRFVAEHRRDKKRKQQKMPGYTSQRAGSPRQKEKGKNIALSS